ncbi:isochorismatase family protein [Pseudomonas sp. TE3610]
MRQVLLIVDIQSTFNPPEWLVDGVRAFSAMIPTIASIELHDEQVTPFERQLGWHPAAEDESLVEADKVFIKHGYGQTGEAIEYIRQMGVERVLVCGMQTETCVLAAGFALFDAGLAPTLVTDLTVGSSLDRSGQMGIALWKHHFREVTTRAEVLAAL